MANHPAPPFAVSESEADTLRAIARAGTTEQRTALRAKIILRAAEGIGNVAIADELGVSVPTVGLWRTRFRERGLAGLADGPRTGRPTTYGREIRERVLATTLTPPGGATHWSTLAWPRRSGSARTRSCGSGARAAYSPIGPRRSSSAVIPFARLLGVRTQLGVDVGVAGLHRLLAELPALAEADAIVVVAGMEGALASIVGGLAAVPVIACPTSVGDGANLGGLTALLAMISSCARASRS